MTYLQEWCVRGTRIQQLPDFLPLFTQLTVLDIPKNAIRELPPDVGETEGGVPCSSPLLRPPWLQTSPAPPALSGRLGELHRLNASYNHLRSVPPELGSCEKLQKLELAGNRSLSELPFEVRQGGVCTWGAGCVPGGRGMFSDGLPPLQLSSLKQLLHLDLAENSFVSIPVCALRMTNLQLLDLSANGLTDLPQDMDR